ncbi:MAG: DsbE family thiol:disulfide interchange protein [Proteobacteria bacterium]|nr:DsbE family thiol:disulfide interchange protein [Burkholderiales bacterium]
MGRFWLPLVGFVVLVAFLAVGLTLNPRVVPSPLIGKAAPAFRLPTLADPQRQFSVSDAQGQVWLLNVWASWCAPCLEEHPLIDALSKQGVPVYGLNYKDKQDAATAWLARHGNPYVLSVVDANGRVGIDYGVYGTPETYLIDKQGVIRFKHVGPLDPALVERTLLPMIEKLRRS